MAGGIGLQSLGSAWQRHAREAASVDTRVDVTAQLADIPTSFELLNGST